uniref:Dynein regulatory complex protein 9 n=1 Tax=Eptatretus burgeri TaxID=7764 RepID=A0A8C4Q4V1_EPTBU
MEAQVDNVHLASVLRTSLNPASVLRVTVILEDSLDQLSIIGALMENGLDPLPNKGGEDDHPSMGFRSKPTSLGNTNVPMNRTRFVSCGLSRLQQSSALKKRKADRQYLWDVLEETRHELEIRGSFENLQRAFKDDKDSKHAFCETLSWEEEEEAKQSIKQLKLEVMTMNQSTEKEVQEYHEVIAELKDQLQNLRTWTTTRSKYMQRRLELQIDEQRRWSLKLENEIRQNSEELEDKLEHWMERYDNDIEDKQQEMNNIKITRANDRTKIQELTKKYMEYESVIIKHELMKEAERKMKEREELEFKSIIKLQAWWRGVRVRKGMVVVVTLSGKKGKGSKGKNSKGKKK